MTKPPHTPRFLLRLVVWVRHHPAISRRLLLVAALNTLFAASLLFKPGGMKLTADIDNLGVSGLAFLGTWWCFAAAWEKREADGGRQEVSHRITLVLLGLGVSCSAAADTIWAYYEMALHRTLVFPSWTDVAFLVQYPLLLGGILRLPTRRLPPPLRWRVVLDSLITLTALVTLSWYFVLGPTLQQGTGSLLAKVLGAADPVGDLVLLVSLLLVMAQRRDSVSRPVAVVLSSALACIIVADTAYSYQTLQGTYTTGNLGDLGWTLGCPLIGLAAGMSRRRMKQHDDRPAVPLLWRSLLPYVLMPVLAALALYVRLHHRSETLAAGVYLGGGVLVGLVLIRQAVAMQRLISDLKERIKAQEKAEELLTALAEQDGLTGLLNHRVFHKRLQEEAEHAERSGQPLTVALIDLNNFKFFNDAYGHLAGDDVLRQAALAIRDCCRSCDTLARFGGDEFALLLPGAGQDEAGRLAARLQSRLDSLAYYPPHHDVAIPLQLSVGTAVFPEEQRGRMDTLALADARLYQAKSGDSGAGATQRLRSAFSEGIDGFSMLDALVTAVDNKDRYTCRHSGDVMTFSLQIADALGMDTEAQHTLAVAALLHDLGKIGVPDAILRKPGRLTEEEFAAIRHHPVMGAVLVKAVPGFEETLDAVRFHHERWDGGGYPEGRRGEETPLIARIMAVADAFSAMTTDRPYRRGMPESKALAEILQGAGTQFDPLLAQTFVSLRQSSAPFLPLPLPQPITTLARAAYRHSISATSKISHF